MCRHDRDHSTELFNSYSFEIDRYTVMTTLCLCFWVVGIRERITLSLLCPTVYCLVVVNGPVLLFGLLSDYYYEISVTVGFEINPSR